MICNRCKADKPTSEFYVSTRTPTGFTRRCKKCYCEVAMQTDKARKARETPEEREARLERQRVRVRRYRERHLEKIQANARAHHIRKHYGLTLADEAMYVSVQRGSCAICRKALTTEARRVVDHCHKSGKVRGVLCNSCNTGLGAFKDDVRVLMRAVAYLIKDQEPPQMDFVRDHVLSSAAR